MLALAWAPCAGPTLGAAFALAADRGSLAAALLTMFVYALGAAAALLAVGFGLGRLTPEARNGAILAGATRAAALGLSLVVFGALDPDRTRPSRRGGDGRRRCRTGSPTPRPRYRRRMTARRRLLRPGVGRGPR